MARAQARRGCRESTRAKAYAFWRRSYTTTACSVTHANSVEECGDQLTSYTAFCKCKVMCCAVLYLTTVPYTNVASSYERLVLVQIREQLLYSTEVFLSQSE